MISDAPHGIKLASYDAVSNQDIASPPTIIETSVTFIEILYVGNVSDLIVLHEEDRLEILAENVITYITTPPETIYIERRNVLSFRVRKSVIKRLVPPTRPSTTSVSDNSPLF